MNLAILNPAALRRAILSPQALLGAVPALLFIPALYYSLDTPFALVDDYGDWIFSWLWGGSESFSGWLARNFGSGDGRYRPFWVFYNAVAWKAFGANPWLYHLSRWVWHFGAVLMFAAAFCRFAGNGQRGNAGAFDGMSRLNRLLPLLPVALLAYLWLFYPNSPASRLFPQEVYTVFFLGLCTWMAALLLTGADDAGRGRSRLLQYGLLGLGCLGLSMTKEVNVAVVLWLAISYYAILIIKIGGGWQRILAGIPLVVIFLLTLNRIYAAAAISGTGYGSSLTREQVTRNAVDILYGLFQVETSFLITAGLGALSLALLCVVIIRAVRRRLRFDNETLFILFLVGQLASMFVILCLSWGIVLRYWYILIPVFTTLLAFSAKFILEAAVQRSRRLALTVALTLSSFIIFFVAANYYNFLWQTVAQHSLRHVDTQLISATTQLISQGEYVQINPEELQDEPGGRLKYYFEFFAPAVYHREHKIHTTPPEESDRPYYYIDSHPYLYPVDVHIDIIGREHYRPLSYARAVSGLLQGGAPYLEKDAGVHYRRDYRWMIYSFPYDPRDYAARLTAAAGELIIRSDWNVYRNGNRLTYVKESCAAADTEADFFLHLVPDNSDHLSRWRRQYGFNNWDVSLDFHSAPIAGVCYAVAVLPDYPITYLRTGQYVPGEGELWDGKFYPTGE